MMADGKTYQTYQLGDIVRTTVSFGPNAAESIGIVYETYPEQDAQAPDVDVISVLLTNGHDIGSFNGEEQLESLTWLGHVDIAYAYRSPAQLMTDYRDGYFNEALAEARVIGDQVGLGNVAHQ